ncbi:hypothetical protein Patl1_12770 [Pistacia atlantica]|uniref:Uncharacterized protein n=1 Tax=Pistacia atlantica TaxID=434234 RepID=A0ACC1AUM6_9ROSI|nr:hypothetical protein Patl1_12770 [Pistacia atlantica]
MWGRSTKLVTLTRFMAILYSQSQTISQLCFHQHPPILPPRRSSLHLLFHLTNSPPLPYVIFVCNKVDINLRKKVEDIMPIATGHELEELEAELQGRNVLEINHPVGPFGIKEAPAIVKSVYDKRIVGCPGGEGEDEHDVVWFWLEKGKPHECAVCSQHFKVKVFIWKWSALEVHQVAIETMTIIDLAC